MRPRAFFHDDALEYRDNFRGSDRERRELDTAIQHDHDRLSQIMRDQYDDAETLASNELQTALRIGREGLTRWRRTLKPSATERSLLVRPLLG